jgi:hypothetical protein
MKEAMVIVLLTWYMNAAMDAIDHVKGGTALYELWHILKAASYWPLYGWIMWKSEMKPGLIVITVMVMGLWEIVYRGLRAMDFYRLDDKLRLPFLRELWRFKRK